MIPLSNAILTRNFNCYIQFDEEKSREIREQEKNTKSKKIFSKLIYFSKIKHKNQSIKCI